MSRDKYSMLDDKAWMESAACSSPDVDGKIFFTVDESMVEGESKFERQLKAKALNIRNEAAAKLVCQSCVSVSDCLQYGLRSGDEIGIYGGTTESERKKLRSPKKRVS